MKLLDGLLQACDSHTYWILYITYPNFDIFLVFKRNTPQTDILGRNIYEPCCPTLFFSPVTLETQLVLT